MTASVAARLATPLVAARLDRLADDLSTADVVGIGPTTREGRQTSQLQHDLLVRLVERGTRLFVLVDSTAAGRQLDAWVQGGAGSVDHALSRAWGPWRTPATASTLRWLRRFNVDHPQDRVHVAGLTEPAATNADVDAVLELVGDGLDPAVRADLALLRSAHDSGEHALRAQEMVDGPPFDVLARRVRSKIIDSRPLDLHRATVHLDRLVTFHSMSMAQGGDPFAGVRRAVAGLLETVERISARAVLWDGAGGVDARGPGAGQHLRDLLGRRYRSVLVSLGGGHLRGTRLPDPTEGTLEAALAGLGDTVLDLDPAGRGDETSSWLRAPTRLRVVNGMYRVERDADFLVALASLSASFDHVVHVAEVEPTTSGWRPGGSGDHGSSRST